MADAASPSQIILHALPPTQVVTGESLSLLQNLDIVALILRHLSTPSDLVAAASVCRIWREAANHQSQLRSWILDDSPIHSLGKKASSTPLLPKTPPPKYWINPAAHSPLAAFKMPRSLMPLKIDICETTEQSRSTSVNHSFGTFVANGQSPRTPSPMQQTLVKGFAFLDIVKEKMIMGRFLGDIDICSSRIDDRAMQLILKNCPRLHTFRLLHLCSASQNCYHSEVEEIDNKKVTTSLPTSCGCSSLSDRAFLDFHKHCPQLTSVTLVLQHVTFRKTLQKLLTELGRLPKLQTLS
eukprot:c53586_g1_i1 orf=54-941(+)